MDIRGCSGITTDPEWIKKQRACVEPLDKTTVEPSEKPRRVTASPLHQFTSAKQPKKEAFGQLSSAEHCVRQAGAARREWLHLRAATVTLIPVWKSKLARWSRLLFH